MHDRGVVAFLVSIIVIFVLQGIIGDLITFHHWIAYVHESSQPGEQLLRNLPAPAFEFRQIEDVDHGRRPGSCFDIGPFFKAATEVYLDWLVFVTKVTSSIMASRSLSLHTAPRLRSSFMRPRAAQRSPSAMPSGHSYRGVHNLPAGIHERGRSRNVSVYFLAADPMQRSKFLLAALLDQHREQ